MPPPAFMPPPLISSASSRALELDSLLAMIAELAATDVGRERVLDLTPAADEADLAVRRARWEEAARLVAHRPLVTAFDVPVGDLVARLESPGTGLAGPDLVRLADLLRAAREAAERIADADPPCPELGRETAALPDLGALVSRIGKALDRRGGVRDDASPELTALRRTIRGTRDRLYSRLSRYVEDHRDELSEETVPLREGRLVVVLQAGARGRLGGLTHGRSATGKSFYFEPLEVVEENNTLQQSIEDEEAERRRIVAELAGEAYRARAGIAIHLELVAGLDLLQAAARFAERCGGRLAELAPPGLLALRGARHPLLVPELAPLREAALGYPGHLGEAVPLDLDLGSGAGRDGDARCLVITGPNAGGKTLALKTAGLLALAAQCGLPVPAETGTRLPFLGSLVATVGDDQDVLRDRSTFSGRLLRLQEAWQAAGPDALILLDELGSGTDPEEGSALAVSLLEGLLASGCLAVITTHLTQLAAAALEMEGAACAAMELSAATGEPTYHLLPGPPGGSEAIALARRLGLPAEWLDRAEARLGTEHRQLRELIAEVERVRRELADAKAGVERELAGVRKERAGVVEKRDALAAERRTLAKRLRAELEAFRVETRRRFQDEVERLVEEVAEGRRKGLAAAATERAFAEAPELPVAAEATGEPLTPGARVRHRALGWEGELASVDGERGEVNVRGKRLLTRLDELTAVVDPAQEAGGGPRAVGRPGKRPGIEVAVRDDEVPQELHLLGTRVEPALQQLDDYLDRALLGARAELRIVHGHGTGRLKKAVREHLRGHPAVASQRPGKPDEGGDGATVVVLR